ncbi:NAD-dependent epimerase/dehydratase family protein [Alteribacter natronophilus]|uniref:NAD-dependent epimerase/dehydratase family protein n=1 Tax=Alteribacter natronophilus TaxID=2583810 RepID=UPI00110E0030|nr:NAD-dependent epimerase/dehydratase family protein [Alteribacter natronophilus]TMW70279.1 NAD-dependent epimerase/dehydratase family protein [Alteribacter natronophilus]
MTGNHTRRKVLVLGGSRFFGRRLAEKLIENGDDVTIATRGNREDGFGSRVRRVTVDRSDRGAMEKTFEDTRWDVVYDQICFSPDDAAIACDIFKERVSHYVLTSTLSVYDYDRKEVKEEKDFDPYDYPIHYGSSSDFSYGEGKRLAEAVFFQRAGYPVTAVRPPIVLGDDDYTERLHYHIRKVKNGEPIGITDLQTSLSFVEAGDLAEFLFWAGSKEIYGPVNASSPDSITLGTLIGLIEEAAGKKADVEVPGEKVEQSPFNFPSSAYQDVSLAEASGYSFRKLTEWLPGLIRRIKDK